MKYTLLLIFFLGTTNMILFDSSTASDLDNWFIVNDGVMGGLSKGKLSINKASNMVFSGKVSLENYGGFTSIRHDFEQRELTGQTKAVLRVKGDGKRYQFRVKTNRDDWHSYIYYFQTCGEWENIEIPLEEMLPSFRGRQLDMPNFSAEYIASITFLIANKQAEEFQLKIDKVVLK